MDAAPRRHPVLLACGVARFGLLLDPLEEVGHRHAEDPRKLIELAGADAVGPELVLLNLLERQSQGIRQLLLRVAQEHPAKAHTSSNMNVYGMGLSGLSVGLVKIGRASCRERVCQYV